MGVWHVPSFASAPPPEADPAVEAVARSAALEEGGPATIDAVASAATGGAESTATGGAESAATGGAESAATRGADSCAVLATAAEFGA